jgi:hypothetical protein
MSGNENTHHAHERALSIHEFCRVEGLSLSSYYKLKKRGLARRRQRFRA